MARRRNKPDPDEEDDPDELNEKLQELGEENADAILRDGARLHVPLYLKDGSINPRLTPTQRGKAAQQTEDARARSFGLTDALQLHKPGFRRNTDAAALARVQDAYNDADEADQNAWRNPSARRATEPTEPRRSQDAASSKAQAYADYDREMANAWRSNR